MEDFHNDILVVPEASWKWLKGKEKEDSKGTPIDIEGMACFVALH